jgi:hypothetical protein
VLDRFDASNESFVGFSLPPFKPSYGFPTGTLPKYGTDTKRVAHLLGIDLPVDDDPGSPPQLGAGREVDNDRLFVGPQVLHNQ